MQRTMCGCVFLCGLGRMFRLQHARGVPQGTTVDQLPATQQEHSRLVTAAVLAKVCARGFHAARVGLLDLCDGEDARVSQAA